MKVFITGVSSFTGCHIARSFRNSSFKSEIKVFATLTKKLPEYSSLESQRLRYSLVDNWIEEAPFGSRNFIDSLNKIKPDILINHGASIKGYREKNFDVQSCVNKALFNLTDVFDILPDTCKVIHSGSIFEKDSKRDLSAYSPYGLAKTLIWEELLKTKKKLSITKIVIPDPVGIFENTDRLGPVFFRKWNLGERVDLRNPDVVQDRIPAPWLARKYVQEAVKDSGEMVEGYRIVRPSAFCKKNLEWVERLAFYFEKKTNKKCPGWNVLANFDGERKNIDPVEEVFDENECDKFFNEYSDWLLK